MFRFVDLFISELLQHCWIDTSWVPDQQKDLAKDPKSVRKLLRLQDRVARKKPLINSSTRLPNPARAPAVPSEDYNKLSELFPDIQEFFYLFIEGGDSFEFNRFEFPGIPLFVDEFCSSHLKQALIGKISEFCERDLQGVIDASLKYSVFIDFFLRNSCSCFVVRNPAKNSCEIPWIFSFFTKLGNIQSSAAISCRAKFG